mgnify:CR=1 FL=1
MNRKQTLEGSFLFQGFEVAGVQIYPLSANRMSNGLHHDPRATRGKQR